MRSVIVLLFFSALTVSAFWFVWMNRTSEKIVSSTLPIAIAAIISIFLAGWIFGGEADYEVVFPVCFMLDLETKLPLDSIDEMNRLPTDRAMIFLSHRFSFGPSPVPELRKQRPDLFTDTTKNDFCRNIYHHLLQRSLIDFWAELYMASWKTEPLLFDLGSVGFGRYGGIPPTGNPPDQVVLRTADLENILKGNWFSRIHRWPSLRLCVPPGSKITVRVPSGATDASGTGEIRIVNRFCIITVATEVALPIRTIGEYRTMAELSDAQANHLATNVYLLRANIHFTKWLSGHPEMKAHKQWAMQLVRETQRQFDEQHIWTQVKEDDLRSHIHPPQSLKERFQRFHEEHTRMKERR